MFIENQPHTKEREKEKEKKKERDRESRKGLSWTDRCRNLCATPAVHRGKQGDSAPSAIKHALVEVERKHTVHRMKKEINEREQTSYIIVFWWKGEARAKRCRRATERASEQSWVWETRSMEENNKHSMKKDIDGKEQQAAATLATAISRQMR